jgi:methyl-accepting chemotaxis protein
MKKNGAEFRLMTLICCVLTVLAIAIEGSFFRGTDVPYYQAFLRIIAIGILFCVATLGVSGRWISSYRFDYARKDLSDGELVAALEKNAGIPIQFMFAFMLLVIGYIVVLGLASAWIGFLPGLTLPILMICLSWGMLGAVAVYYWTERVNIRFLLDQRLSRYPRTHRVRRQKTRTSVSPGMSMILGLMYAFSVSATLVGKWGSLAAMPVTTYVTTGFGVVVFVTTVILLSRLWSGNLTTVYDSISSQLDQLSSGEKNLGNRVFIASVDEIGTIGGLINEFTAGLASSIDGIKATQKELGSVGMELQRSAEKSAGAIQSISGSMSRVSEKSGAQAESVREVSTAVEQIAGNISSLDRLITDQAASVTEASASIEEMVGNIGSISNSMGVMAREFATLADTARNGTATQETSAKRIAEIAENSKALQGANKVIAQIASQTNLLAMNAAIEAAHAGEAGAGFAVVADEIRVLAENAAKNSRKISTVLSDVQKGIESVVMTSKDSKDAFSEVAEKIGTTDAVVQEFRMAIGEQQEGAKQILEALQQMNDITAQVKNGSSEMTAGSSTILREVGLLRTNSAEIGERYQEIAAGIGEVSRDSALVSAMAEKTQVAITQLDAAVGSFRTDQA